MARIEPEAITVTDVSDEGGSSGEEDEVVYVATKYVPEKLRLTAELQAKRVHLVDYNKNQYKISLKDFKARFP